MENGKWKDERWKTGSQNSGRTNALQSKWREKKTSGDARTWIVVLAWVLTKNRLNLFTAIFLDEHFRCRARLGPCRKLVFVCIQSCFCLLTSPFLISLFQGLQVLVFLFQNAFSFLSRFAAARQSGRNTLVFCRSRASCGSCKSQKVPGL